MGQETTTPLGDRRCRVCRKGRVRGDSWVPAQALGVEGHLLGRAGEEQGVLRVCGTGR